MSCNCGCLEHVDCTCPDLTGVSAAQEVAYITNVYSPAEPTNGAGFNVVLYTNSSASSQTVLVQTNLYLIGTDATTITTTTYTKSAVPLTGQAVAVKEDTPLKVDHTHFLGPTTLTAGQNISITILTTAGSSGLVGSPTLSWLKSIVYKY